MSEMIMTFGKYKGKSIDVVPMDYMEWMLKSGSLEEVSAPLKIEIYRILCRHEVIDNDINEIIKKVGEDDARQRISLQWKTLDELPIENAIVRVGHLKVTLRFKAGEFYSRHDIKISKSHIEKWAYADNYHNRRLLRKNNNKE